MKERPILFSGPMVRAILEGRKTQTRRVVKESTFKATKQGRLMHEGEAAAWCPYGQPGDRLWVRETWSKALHGCGVELLERWEPGKEGPFGVGAIYAATPHPDYKPDKWKPSIHMPRWASRITLEVTGVRVERLRDITMKDVMAEGCILSTSKEEPLDFQNLWTSINGPESWASNPWVWVVEFRKI